MFDFRFSRVFYFFNYLGSDLKMALPGGHVAAAVIFGTIACLLGLAAFLYLFR
jgi:hypothetical protein